MTVPLRVLVLEDSAEDAELAVAALEDAGYSCAWDRVQTQNEFVSRLQANNYDLILADYNLPTFDGLTALQVVRARRTDVPFILISGTVGEETAIECLKAGATDYVLKNGLQRLASVVGRALREREAQLRRQRAEEEKSALLDVARDLNGILEMDELLDRVQRRVADVLPCDAVLTFLWEPERKAFQMISQYGLPDELSDFLRDRTFPRDPMLVERGVAARSVVVNDVSEWPLLSAEPFFKFGISSVVTTPLVARGPLLGTFVAVNFRGRRFSAEQVQLLESVAGQLSVAIDAARLYEVQQEEAEVSAALARVGQELISSLDAPELLERLCRLTTEVLSCDYSHTFLWDEAQKYYLPVSGYGDSPERWEAIRVLKIPRWRLDRYFAAFERADVFQVTAGPQENDVLSLPKEYGISLAMYMALRRGGDLVGFHSAGFLHRREPFSRQQQRIAGGVAQLASLALQNARLVEELERANRVKSDFVASMSHELRTPLNVIMGYQSLLIDGAFGDLNPEQADHLRRAQQSARGLLDLISATLDLSRLEAGAVPLSLTEVRLADLLAEIDTDLREARHKPGVKFECHIRPEVPCLRTDAVKLKVVLKNLISNALKFTEQGSVRVTAALCDGGVEISVADTGIGIEREALAKIFDPFQQADASISNRYGGAGLGLYIVRRLVDSLGGAIEVKSEPRRGSVFRVRLKAAEGLR